MPYIIMAYIIMADSWLTNPKPISGSSSIGMEV